jgi:hypothetical protein
MLIAFAGNLGQQDRPLFHSRTRGGVSNRSWAQRYRIGNVRYSTVAAFWNSSKLILPAPT